MKKMLPVLFLLFVLLSGFQSQTFQTTTQTQSPALAATSAPYATYYKKYTELTKKYGKGKLVEKKSDVIGDYSYLSGVCVADLIDYNSDKTKDLLVVYCNGKLTGKNMEKNAIPQAASYQIEVWTYQNGSLKQLMKSTYVGSFDSYDPSFADTDNCFVTVYANAAGRAVIQLFAQNKDSLTYTNYSSAGKDSLTYKNNSYQLNGKTIAKTQWEQKVDGYKKILLCAHLSSSDINSSYLKNTYGLHYQLTLDQTKKVTTLLAQNKPGAFASADSSYIPLYLKILDQMNQGDIKSNKGTFAPYEYSICDIDKNGVPELLVKTGVCEADYTFHVYTIVKGKLTVCDSFSGGHTTLYAGKRAGIINYWGHMGTYEITKMMLKGTKFSSTDIASGPVNEVSDFPSLSKYGLGDYQTLASCYIRTPFLLYSYAIQK